MKIKKEEKYGFSSFAKKIRHFFFGNTKEENKYKLCFMTRVPAVR